MKYFTKEWFYLMQKVYLFDEPDEIIPDKEYTDEEIGEFYRKDLGEYLLHMREDYDEPPQVNWELWEINGLDPDNFTPSRSAFANENGEAPKTVDEARANLERANELEIEKWKKRPPYDPKEDIEFFKERYQSNLKNVDKNYPSCVTELTDPRLLALGRMTENVHKLYTEYRQKLKNEFDSIEEEGDRVLKAQDIPEETESRFRFHDADILALRKSKKDLHLYMRNEYMWTGEKTPYVKVIFKNAAKIDREKGFSIRPGPDRQGKLSCSCQFLYHELYRTEKGYEVHMMLWTWKSLRYLTVECEDIEFEEDITIEEICAKKEN